MNCWRLRGVCQRFKKIVETTYVFKFADFRPILENGNADILKLYLKQHDYANYGYDFKKIKLADPEMVKILHKRKIHGSEGGIEHAARIGSVGLIKLYRNLYDCDICRSVYFAFKYNHRDLMEYFSTDLQKEATYAVDAFNGAMAGGNYELARRFNLWERGNLKYAIIGGNTKIFSIMWSYQIYPTTAINCCGKVGNIELAEKIGGSPFQTYQAMCHACSCGHVAFVKHFINRLPQFGFNELLIDSCIGGNVELINLMLERGANNYSQAFAAACKHRHLPVVKILAGKTHVDLNKAISGGSLEIVKYCLSVGCKVKKGSVTTACAFHSYEISEYLIQFGYGCSRCVNYSYREKCPVGKKLN